MSTTERLGKLAQRKRGEVPPIRENRDKGIKLEYVYKPSERFKQFPKRNLKGSKDE